MLYKNIFSSDYYQQIFNMKVTLLTYWNLRLCCYFTHITFCNVGVVIAFMPVLENILYKFYNEINFLMNFSQIKNFKFYNLKISKILLF